MRGDKRLKLMKILKRFNNSDVDTAAWLVMIVTILCILGFLVVTGLNLPSIATPQPQSSGWHRVFPTPPPVPFQYRIEGVNECY